MKKVIPEDSVLIPDQAEQVFKGEIFDVYQWPQTMFDGSMATFEMLKRADTASAICVTDNKILVLDEEQPGSRSRKNFPGGRVDPTDASIIDAAQREVLEETGYSFKNWRLIKVFQPYVKLEWFIHIVLAWEVISRSSTIPEPGEKISVQAVSFDELKQLVDAKAGYLGESADIFKKVNSLFELLDLPEFQGQPVDR